MNERLLSLDVLRGITVAGMILVNNAGGEQSYAPLRHSVWHGLTFCDLIFPFFLFIMGASAYFSLCKTEFRFSKAVARKILRRTLLILLIGWGITLFHHLCEGNFRPWADFRIWGVLPRIALCYGVVSLLAILMDHRRIPGLIAVLLIGYAVLLAAGHGFEADGSNVLSIVDRALFGEAHLYRKSPIDPEGFLSTWPAVAHTLVGFWCGRWIVRLPAMEAKMLHLFVAGFLMLVVGVCFSDLCPLNKRIWSPTFVLVTCGSASLLWATLMFFLDWKGRRELCTAFRVFGVNPLFLYVLSEVLAIVIDACGIKPPVYDAIRCVFPDPYFASLIYSVSFTGLLWLCGYLLYRKKIYIKL